MNDKFKEAAIRLGFENFDKLYIHCANVEGLYIGKRGLVGNEVTNGIMLAFSSVSSKNMNIHDEGIMAELRFAGTWEEIFVPYYAIDAILDDLQEPSFIFNFIISLDEIKDLKQNNNTDNTQPTDKTNNTAHKTAEILKPDFTKKRK